MKKIRIYTKPQAITYSTLVFSNNPCFLCKGQSVEASPCENCSQGPPAKKTGRGPLLNRPSCPLLDESIAQGTELNPAES